MPGDLRIDILASPNSRGAILYGLRDLLSVPGQGWAFAVERERRPSIAQVRIVAANAEPFRCTGGVPVTPDAALDDANDAQIVCIPNFTLPPGESHAVVFRAEIEWLKRRYEAGATLASVCSGAILLAETGLLDGEEATSHWSAKETFRTRFPQVRFQSDKTIVFAGEGNRIVQGGGMSSWQDVALYLIARFIGPDHAAKTARFYCIETRTDGQLQFNAHSRFIQRDDAVIRECQRWLADNYAVPDALVRMQQRSGLTRRSFDRRFRTATGYSPREYLQSLRIEEAKQLLEASRVPVDAVAEAIGYTDPRPFQRLFQRFTGLTASAYRRRFGHDRFLLRS